MTVSQAESVPVKSTLLTSVAYDSTQSILRLVFRDGAIYRYLAVPSDVYRGLLAAESKGSYFNRLIRNRFVYALLSGPK